MFFVGLLHLRQHRLVIGHASVTIPGARCRIQLPRAERGGALGVNGLTMAFETPIDNRARQRNA
jgi:hypothetical protein